MFFQFQLSYRFGQNDYFENEIKLGGSKWKMSNLSWQNQNNTKLVRKSRNQKY